MDGIGSAQHGDYRVSPFDTDTGELPNHTQANTLLHLILAPFVAEPRS
jgi:hypothetical protein